VCILAMVACSEKARLGFLGYSISKYGFWINGVILFANKTCRCGL